VSAASGDLGGGVQPAWVSGPAVHGGGAQPTIEPGSDGGSAAGRLGHGGGAQSTASACRDTGGGGNAWGAGLQGRQVGAGAHECAPVTPLVT
jgi:hypothetical protein